MAKVYLPGPIYRKPKGRPRGYLGHVRPVAHKSLFIFQAIQRKIDSVNGSIEPCTICPLLVNEIGHHVFLIFFLVIILCLITAPGSLLSFDVWPFINHHSSSLSCRIITNPHPHGLLTSAPESFPQSHSTLLTVICSWIIWKESISCILTFLLWEQHRWHFSKL